MALKRASLNLAAATPTKKGDHPVIVVEDNPVQRYALAVAAMKEAEGTVKLLRPEVEAIGLTFLHEQNVANPTSQVGTVKVQDATGAEARVTSQDRYSAADAQVVTDLFDVELKVDVNTYFTESVKASFDNDFFLNKDGEFDQAAYDEVKAAIEKIATKRGKTMPLTAKTVVITKPDFHKLRYIKFTAAQNEEIQATVRNTVTITPLSAGQLIVTAQETAVEVAPVAKSKKGAKAKAIA